MYTNLYVIIVTFNGAKWTRRCLGSVYSSSVRANAIVIDNGSTDETLDIIRTEFPQCKIIETHQNLGFGRANNIGIKEALEKGAEYIYLLNQDAWVEADVFEKMICTQRNNPDYGVLSPIQMNGLGTDYDSNFKVNSIAEDHCPNCLVDISQQKAKDVYESNEVIAAHWLIYAPYLKRVGLFSPAFPHYGEDNNLFQRFMFWGYKLGICPKAIAYHDRQDRVTPPEHRLYKLYIFFLIRVNNILIADKFTVFRAYLGFVKRSIMFAECPLVLRLETIKKGTKSYWEANGFKKEYQKEYNSFWGI